MNWISIEKSGLPECWSQHGKSFASGYVLTYNKFGEFEINQYWQHGTHTGMGWIKEREGWEENDGNITHYVELVGPNKTKK